MSCPARLDRLRFLRRALPALLFALVCLASCAGRDAEQRITRAAAQYAAGEYRAAAIEVQNVLQDDPTNVRANLLLGSVWLATGDNDAARQRLAAARDHGAPVEEFAVPLADALVRLGQLEQARAELDRV